MVRFTIACGEDSGEDGLGFLEGHDGPCEEGLQESPVTVVVCRFDVCHGAWMCENRLWGAW